MTMMVKLLLLLACTAVLCCCTGVKAIAEGGAKVYYVDSRKGDDGNSGLRGKPWRSLERVNREVFRPGDKVLFRAGCVFGGQLEVHGDGLPGKPISVGRYGRGKKPLLQGNGEKLHTLLISDCEYWEVSDLEITNRGRQAAAKRCGVLIRAWDKGDVHHIRLKRLTVHDVNGSCIKDEGGGNGIYWHNGGERVLTRFVGLSIEDCHVYNCQRNGITGNGNSRRSRWYPSLGVVIRNNLIEQVPGDAIVPIACDGALVEHNVVRDSPDILRFEDAAAGIWPWSCDNTVIQYNEVSGQSAKWDGQGFDSDYNCRNTLIQYNYSHDNAGGFILICNEGNTLGQDYNIGTENTVVRYNVSLNDGLRPYPTRSRWFAPVMHITGPVKNTKIYNNVIVVKRKPAEKIDRAIMRIEDWGGAFPEELWFANNIFYVMDDEREYVFDLGKGKNTHFTHNLYSGNFNSLPADSAGVYQKPGFLSGFPSHLRKKVRKGLRLKSSSPCIGAGIAVEDNGGRDFRGKRIKENKPRNIGAYEER